MKKLFIQSLLLFSCFILFFGNLLIANDLCVDNEVAPIVNIIPASLCDDGMGNITPTTITPLVTGGDGNYTYNWITPVGYTGPTDEAQITTSVAGDYILTVTDGNMCSDTETTTVTIATPPEVEIVVNSNTCVGTQISVIANANDPDNDDNGNYFYSWSVTGAASVFQSSITDPNATITAAANTIAGITVTDSNGCVGTDELEIVLNPLPSFPALPTILVCVPGYVSTDLTQFSADLLANLTNGTIIWYEFGAPGSGGIPIANPTNVNVPVVMPIYAQITDDDTGCQNEARIPISFDDTPTANAGLDLSICNASAPITLTGNLPANHTGVWSGASSLTDNGNGTAIFDPTGIIGQFILTYTLTSKFGCEDSDDMVITVNQPTPININTNDVSDCGASDGAASVSSPAGILDVQWSTGDMTPTINDLTPGGYGVTVTDNNSCTTTDYALISTQIPSEYVEVILDITRINFPPLADGGDSATEWGLDFGGTAWMFSLEPQGTSGLVEINNLLENFSGADCSTFPTEVSLGDYNIAAGSTASIDLMIFESDNPAGGIPHSCIYDGAPTDATNPIDSGNGTGDDLLYDGTINFDLTSSGVIILPLLSGVGAIEIEYVLTCVSGGLGECTNSGGQVIEPTSIELCAGDSPYILETMNEVTDPASGLPDVLWAVWVLDDPLDATAISGGPVPDDPFMPDDTNYFGLLNNGPGQIIFGTSVELMPDGSGVTYYIAPLIGAASGLFDSECTGLDPAQGYTIYMNPSLDASVSINTCDIQVDLTGGFPLVDNTANYSWSYTTPDGGIITGAGTPIIVLGEADGDYIFSITNDGNDCDLLNFATVMLVDCDTITSTANTISNQYTDLIDVFPNPFNDEITVDISRLPIRAERFILYDVNGRAIKTSILNHLLSNRYNTSELDAGMYFYEILNEKNERLARGKLLK